MPEPEALRDALRALIEQEGGGRLTAEQVEQAVEGALLVRRWGQAVSSLNLGNGEMPFVATVAGPTTAPDEDA